MLKEKMTIFFLAPHTDDAEFGAGGTISKLIEEGHEVFYIAFSACEQSVLKHLPKDILTTEVKKATQVLGIKKENLILFNYEVRTFNFHRQDILQNLIDLREKYKPDLIFMPSFNDVHQDHKTIADEGMRAFKFSSIMCYEVPWNNFTFETSSFFLLEQRHIDLKIKALEQYESQKSRNYANPKFIESLAIVRGVQIGQQYAETFDVIRWILR